MPSNLKPLIVVRAITIIYTLFVLTGCVNQAPLATESWKYSKFIQEVKNGKVEKVNLDSSRTKAFIKVKQDPNLKQVILDNDPKLVDLLVKHNIDISVMP